MYFRTAHNAPFLLPKIFAKALFSISLANSNPVFASELSLSQNISSLIFLLWSYKRKGKENS